MPIETDEIPDLPFDVSKFAITTTPPGSSPKHSLVHSSGHSRKGSNEKSDNEISISLEKAEFVDQIAPKQQTNGSNKQSTSSSKPRTHNRSVSESIGANSITSEHHDPKEASATNYDSNHQSDHLSKQSPSKTNDTKSTTEPKNEIEALKAKAHAERMARKAAKEARKAKSGTKDDNDIAKQSQHLAAHAAQQVSSSAPNSPVDHAVTTSPRDDVSKRSVSKHKLLAPPPIQSSRNHRDRAGSASQSASPISPPSPYLSPSHPKRQNEGHYDKKNEIFDLEFLAMFERAFSSRQAFQQALGNLLNQILSPQQLKSLFQHRQLVLGLGGVLLVAVLVITDLPLFSWVFSLLRSLRSHPLVTASVLAVTLSAYGVRHRRSLRALYEAVFLPPLTDSFPDAFDYEVIQLSEQPPEMLAKWAKEIDQHSSVSEASEQTSSVSDASPAPRTPSSAQSPHTVGGDSLPLMFSRMSGSVALSLMQSYQLGELEDCEFKCLRIYRKDSQFFRHSSDRAESDDDDTMGFVFVSIKKHYDVSPSLLRIFTPIQVCFPWLCLPALWSARIRRMMTFRFGVIGFHWPFRAGIFFTKPVDEFKSVLELDMSSLSRLTDSDQVDESNEAMTVHIARTAAFIAVAKQWDSSRPVNERCDFLLYTVPTASQIVNAVSASGGAPLPILPTYVADLRTVKGQDWQAYKRYLRHQNRKVREGPFENAGGHADLTKGKDMTDVEAEELVSMWHRVAGFRGSRDATSCLMEPTVPFIHQLTHHPSGFVDFLSLKLNNTTVAASLLFSLGSEVLTSDVAGFNYDALEEAGRKANQQIKAYPVKLASVIKHGIAHGFEFVDFGPTTGPSKMELGCKEIKLTGGLFYHGTFTSIVVSLAACCLSSQHSVASR